MTRTVTTRLAAQQLCDSLRASGMAAKYRERRRDFVVTACPIQRGPVKLRLDAQKRSYGSTR